MPSRMLSAMDRLADRMTGRVGVTVTLKRGQFTTTDVPTVLGNQLLKVTDPNTGDVTTVRTDKDFLIGIDDYRFNLTPTQPLRGDRIVETIESVERTYEVLPYGDEPVYRFADEFDRVYRIHTKRVA